MSASGPGAASAARSDPDGVARRVDEEAAVTTDDDSRVAWLQRLLDDSYGRAGPHLRAIHTDAARLSAEAVVRALEGMRVFVLATVSPGGRPLTAPVDAYLVGGRLHLGTSPDAVRTRHLATSPWVSATYAEGEGVVVTIHGRALPTTAATGTPFGDAVRAHHGSLGVYEGAPCWVIEPDRMFAADMRVHTAGTA